METSSAYNLVDMELQRCRPWIEAALGYSGNTHNFEDIVCGVKAGTMQLWPALHSCLVTEIVIYPRKKLLNIFLAGGELNELMGMQADVEKWAIREGCDGGMISGRRGWERPLKKFGWKFQHVYYTKEIEN